MLTGSFIKALIIVFSENIHFLNEPDLVAIGVQQEVTIWDEEQEEAPSQPESTPEATLIKNPFSVKCSIEHNRGNPDVVSYYTGFQNYYQFMTFFHCLGPCVWLQVFCTWTKGSTFSYINEIKARQRRLWVVTFFSSLHIYCIKKSNNLDNFFVFSTERIEFLAFWRYYTRF